MTGDASDMLRRLRLTLPARWFADDAPVLDGLLAGLSVAWTALYVLLQFVRTQSRIATATNGFLDLAAQDFLSDELNRRPSEGDNSFRSRLQQKMRQGRVTRAALVQIASEAGYSLTVFEAAQPVDTGAYSIPSRLAWNLAGGWGSLQMPFESLLLASPGDTAFQDELVDGIAAAVPAGGAGWLRIAKS